MKTHIFDKREIMMLKGIGIILMFMHHLFYGSDLINNMAVKTVLVTTEQLSDFSIHIGKVCVAIFVFCTSYGLSCKFAENRGGGDNKNHYFTIY